MKHIKKFNENIEKSEKKVELMAWRIVELMHHTDDYSYERADTNGEIEWYNEGELDIPEFELSRKDPELYDELETAYQASKQGYAHLEYKK